jgi:hypothetical protein
MKLLFYEFKKIFTFKIFKVCLALLLVINGVVLWYTQSIDQQTELIHSNLDKYETLLTEYGDMERSDAQEKLISEQTIGDIINLIANGTSISNSQDFIDAELESQRNMYPDEYSEAMKRLSDNYDEAYYSLLSNISAQISYADTYKEFVDGMEKRAENKQRFSVMSESDSFSKKNIAKTVEDFKAVSNVTPTLGNYKYFENSTTFQITDYLLIVLVILICIALFSAERDKKLFNIVRSTRNGLLQTIVAKLSAILLLTFAISVLFFSSNILISGAYTGFGNLLADVQSLEIMMNCPFRLSVIQYLVLWVLTKSLAMCVLATFFATVFLFIGSNALDYIICLLFVAIEFVLYTFIDANFFINQFKYINIFAFLWDNNTLGNYLNINIFGEAVSLTTIFIVVSAIAFVVFIFLSIFVYVKNVRLAGNDVNGKLFGNIRGFCSAHFNTVCIHKLELRKVAFRGVTVAMFVFLCLFAYSQYTQNVEVHYYDAKKSCYAGYLLKLSVEITPSKEQYIEKEKQFFDSIDKQIDKIKADKSITDEDKESKISTLENIQSVRGEAFDEVLEQYEYSKTVAKQLGIKTQMIDRDIGSLLLSSGSREWTQFVLMLLFIIVVLPQVFAYEYRNGADVLLRTCRKGRRELVTNKVIVAFVVSAVAYLLIYLPFVINFVNVYGVELFNIPIVFVEKFAEINSSMTIMQYLILVSVVRIALFLTAIMITLAISVRLKTAITSMVVMTVLTLVPSVAVMLDNTIRFSALFTNGMWIYWVITMCIVSVALFIISFIYILNKFSNTSVRRNLYEIRNT